MSSTEEVRPARMWRQMPSELRTSAAAAFWSDEQAALEQAEAVALIARQIKFRPKSVLTLPVEKKARHLAGLAQVSDLLAARLLIARSEERRVGKECRSRGSPEHGEEKRGVTDGGYARRSVSRG